MRNVPFGDVSVSSLGAAITFGGGLMNSFPRPNESSVSKGWVRGFFLPTSTALLVDVFPHGGTRRRPREDDDDQHVRHCLCSHPNRGDHPGCLVAHAYVLTVAAGGISLFLAAKTK